MPKQRSSRSLTGRRTAGHIGVRSRTVCRKSVVSRHQRRIFFAGRRRADLGKRFHSRLRRQPHAVDDQEGQADRARRAGRAGRYRCAQARLSDAGADRRARRRRGDGGSAAGGACAGAEGRAEAGRRSNAMRERIRVRRQSSFSAAGRIEQRVHRSAHAEQGGRRDSAGGPRGGVRIPAISAAGCRAICACRTRAPRA